MPSRHRGSQVTHLRPRWRRGRRWPRRPQALLELLPHRSSVTGFTLKKSLSLHNGWVGFFGFGASEFSDELTYDPCSLGVKITTLVIALR